MGDYRCSPVGAAAAIRSAAARSARRGRPRARAPAGPASSSCQTGSSTPCPAVRSRLGEPAGSWSNRPGRWSAIRASDWSANSGWRSQTDTMSSIEASSIHSASFSSAARRAARSPPSSIPAEAPTVTSARSGQGRVAPREARGARRASSRRSRPPPPPPRFPRAAPRRCPRRARAGRSNTVPPTGRRPASRHPRAA